MERRKNSVAEGENGLKKFELSHCIELLLKSDEAINELRKNHEAVYKQLNEVDKLKVQIRKYKQHLQEIIFSSIQQIVSFSQTEMEINDGNNFIIVEFDANKVNELVNFLSNSPYYMNLLRNQLHKDMREFIGYYTKNFCITGVEVTHKGSKKFYIAKKKEKIIKTGQDLSDFITPEYFVFLAEYTKFVEESKHLIRLQFSESLISSAIDELLGYWIKNYISPYVYQFTQKIIENIYKQFYEFNDNFSILILENRITLPRT